MLEAGGPGSAQISSAAAFPVFESAIGPVQIVLRLGSPELKREVIPAVCGGQRVVGISMSEPDAGAAQRAVGGAPGD